MVFDRRFLPAFRRYSIRFFGESVRARLSVLLSASLPQTHEDEILSLRARQYVDAALVQWRQSEHEGDKPRQCAFSSLHMAHEHASPLDIRLYLYMLSNEGGTLYQAYAREVIE